MTKKDKTKLKRAAAELADVAEIHLAKLPEDEQAARVAAFSKEHFIDSF